MSCNLFEDNSLTPDAWLLIVACIENLPVPRLHFRKTLFLDEHELEFSANRSTPIPLKTH